MTSRTLVEANRLEAIQYDVFDALPGRDRESHNANPRKR